MLANTITLTIATVAKVLTRVNQDNYGSTYKYTSATESIQLQFRNSVEKSAGGSVDRHNMFVERTVFGTPTANEFYTSFSATFRARRGTSPTDATDLVAAASSVLSANAAALAQGDS